MLENNLCEIKDTRIETVSTTSNCRDSVWSFYAFITKLNFSKKMVHDSDFLSEGCVPEKIVVYISPPSILLRLLYLLWS
jgi:hypothetical protein